MAPSSKGTGFFLPRGYDEKDAAKPAGGTASSTCSSIIPTKSRVSTSDSQPRRKGGAGRQQQHIPPQQPSLSIGAVPPPPPPHPGAECSTAAHAPVCQPPPPPPPPRSSSSSSSGSTSPPGSSGPLPGLPAAAGASFEGNRPSFESWVEGDSFAAPATGALPTQPLAQPQLHISAVAAACGEAESAPLLTYIPTATPGARPAAPVAFRSSTLLSACNHSVGSLGQFFQAGSGLTGVQLAAAAGAGGQVVPQQQQQQQQQWPAGLLEPRPCVGVQSAPVPKLGSPFGELQQQQQQLQLQQQLQQQPQQDADVMLLRPLSPGDAISAELAAMKGELKQTLASLQLRLAAARLAAGEAELDAPFTLGAWEQQQQQQAIVPMLSPSQTMPVDISAALAGQRSAPVAGLGLSLGTSLATSPAVLGGSVPTASTMASVFDSGSCFAACADWDNSLDQNAVFLGDRASSYGATAGLRQSSLTSMGGSDLGRPSVSAAAAAGGGSWVSAGASGEVFEGTLQLQDLPMHGGVGTVAGGLGIAAGQAAQQQTDVGVLAAAAAQQKLQQMAALEALQNQLRQDVVDLLHWI